jgi:SNF2 family DNA or RNA helicase
MYILHGTWIPEATDSFIQTGQFCLWVETAEPSHRRQTGVHPNHLQTKALLQFWTETLGITPLIPKSPSYYNKPKAEEAILTHHFLLPTAKGWPLPSWEMAQYLEAELPEQIDWQYWQITCLPALIAPTYSERVCNVIQLLNELQFLTQYRLLEVQMGTDLLFWYHYTQAFKQVILRDQYIPALKYRALTPPPTAPKTTGGRKRKTQPDSPMPEACEIYPGWEIVSEPYQTLVQAFAGQLPPFCCAGFSAPVSPAQLYEPTSLLQQFSEVLLTDIVTHTPQGQGFFKKIDQTLLENCLSQPELDACWVGEVGLTYYQKWREWRDPISQSQAPDTFTLGFRLSEPPHTEAPWHLAFQIAPPHSSSFSDLQTYWQTPPKKRASLGFGADFEQGLLLHLGYAARVYPKLWQGLNTDQPDAVQLSLTEAFDFLQETAWVLEDAGYRVSIPAWWTPKGQQRAKVRLKAKSMKPSNSLQQGYFSQDSLIAYDYEFAIGAQTVSEQEWQQLIRTNAPLVQFRGEWMLLDLNKMQQMLAFWQKQQETHPELTLTELMRISATQAEELEIVVNRDKALAEMLERLAEKATFTEVPDPEGFQGSLRPYQRRGVGWLTYLEQLGLNGCLADDMGMGKSAQVIARLVHERSQAGSPAPTAQPKTTKRKPKTSTTNPVGITPLAPTLLIAPTSVVGNWGKEIEKFAPHLRYHLHHGADRIRDKKAFTETIQACDVVITSYTMVRMDETLLTAQTWKRIVIDEAQNIKNPKAAQTKALLKLTAPHRLALTGTPVENRLLDLWSIFNFLNPGYLGKEAHFRNSFEIPIQRDHDQHSSSILKKLVEPFILRRVKTDPNIIPDLPDKVEQKCYCNLTKEQAALYEVVVKEISESIDEAEGIQRKGMILATLLKLKQICNHPAQFLQDNSEFSPDRSQKLERLLEMVDEVMAEGESLLVFTQFTEIGDALEKALRHRRYATYYLHGGTPRKKREAMIAEFQSPETEPSIFILSLKAGGVGITLTKANHVFHFDRWWNPAVENQATDRAFRIGQTKNVFVHKFVAIGTLEEKIDQMIEDKKQIAGAIVGNDESWLSKLDNQAFKQLIALNRKAVVA